MLKQTSMRTITDVEIWAGIECTINRVKDSYFDQLKFASYKEWPPVNTTSALVSSSFSR